MPLGPHACAMALLAVITAGMMAREAAAAPPTAWVVESGPPVAAVYAFVEAADGAMWMGGQQGVTRFDGSRGTTFGAASMPGLATTHAFHLQECADESLYVGTGWGLPSLFDVPPHTGGLVGAPGLFRFRKNEWNNVAGNSQLPSVSVQAMFCQPGTNRLWFASDTALWLMQNDQAQVVASVHKVAAEWITAIAAAGQSLWLGTTQGLYHTQADEPSGPPNPVMKAAVTKLLADSKGGVWVGTNDGLFQKDATNTPAAEVAGLPDRNVRDLVYDNGGNLWIATLGGVCRHESKSLKCWTERDGLPDARVLSLYVDRNNVVWLGTRAAGVVRLTPRIVQNLKRGEGLEGYVAQAIASSKAGGMWVASDAAVSKHQDGNVVPVITWQSPPSWVSMAEDASGALWVGKSDGSLFRVSDKRVNQFSQGNPQRAIHTVACPRSAELWVGWQAGGISKAAITGVVQESQDLPFAHYSQADGMCPGVMVGAVAVDPHTLWFPMDNGRITELRDDKFSCRRVAENGETDPHFSTVLKDVSGNIWIGAVDNGGIYLYREGRFLHADERDGMACDSLHALVDDGDTLWTACGTGVQRLSKRQLVARMMGGKDLLAPLRFDGSAGMASQEASWLGGPVAAKDQSHRIWVATQLGVSIIDGHASLPQAPRPRIESLQINGIINNDESIPAIRASSFTTSALLSSTSLAAQGRVYHRYRVRGYSDTWTAAAGGALQLPALPWGHYTLEVMAANGFGIWSDQTTKRSFVLLRPFYRNPWVLGGVGISLALIALAAHRTKQRRQRIRLASLRQERDRMSRDLHDGMGQGFSSIGFHLEAIEESLGQSPQNLDSLRALLGQTRDILDRSQAAARQAVWDLRDLQEQTPDLGVALQTLVRTHMLGRTTPKVVVKVGTLAGPRNLFAEQELALLAKEALTNALRHAHAKTVVIEADRDSDFMHLSIKDDGVGLAPDQLSLASEGHFGILGMHERVRRLAGTINIVSLPGKGTEIVVAVPTGKTAEPTYPT